MCVFKHKKMPLLPPGHHDGRTSARSTHLRRALIHFSPSPLLRHTLHHTNHPALPSPYRPAPQQNVPLSPHPVMDCVPFPPSSDAQRATTPLAAVTLSLSHLAHTAHTKGCNTQITSTTPLLCRLLPPASFTQPPGLFSHRQMCSFSLHHSHTHTLVQHTHAAHTPRKISASRRATLPWEEHSLKDKKTRPRSPSSPSFSAPYLLRFTRCSAARAPPSSPRGCHSPPTSRRSGSPTTHSSHSAS